MKIILNLIVLGIQGIITFITLMVIYMIFVLMDYQGGFDGFIGTTLIQPILGALISLVTIGMCLLIGLPVRLSSSINAWWTKRIWLAILGVLLGFSLIIISLFPTMAETIETTIENEVVQKRIPHVGFLVAGWFVTGFSLLHLFPPYRFRIWVEEKINNFTGSGNENAPNNEHR